MRAIMLLALAAAVGLAGCAGDFNVDQTEPIRVQVEDGREGDVQESTSSVRLTEAEPRREFVIENTNRQTQNVEVNVQAESVSEEPATVVVIVNDEETGEEIERQTIVVQNQVIQNVNLNVSGDRNVIVVTQVTDGEAEVSVGASPSDDEPQESTAPTPATPTPSTPTPATPTTPTPTTPTTGAGQGVVLTPQDPGFRFTIVNENQQVQNVQVQVAAQQVSAQPAQLLVLVVDEATNETLREDTVIVQDRVVQNLDLQVEGDRNVVVVTQVVQGEAQVDVTADQAQPAATDANATDTIDASNATGGDNGSTDASDGPPFGLARGPPDGSAGRGPPARS